MIQTLWMKVRGEAPPPEEIDAYCDRLNELLKAGGRLKALQLYTIARATAETWVAPLDRRRARRHRRARRNARGGAGRGVLRRGLSPAGAGYYLSGCGVVRRYGFLFTKPFGNFVFASASEMAGEMITSSPGFQSAGVDTE